MHGFDLLFDPARADVGVMIYASGMTFPEFCARQARRTTMLIVAAVAVLAGVFGYAAYRRGRAVRDGSAEGADGG